MTFWIFHCALLLLCNHWICHPQFHCCLETNYWLLPLSEMCTPTCTVRAWWCATLLMQHNLWNSAAHCPVRWSERVNGKRCVCIHLWINVQNTHLYSVWISCKECTQIWTWSLIMTNKYYFFSKVQHELPHASCKALTQCGLSHNFKWQSFCKAETSGCSVFNFLLGWVLKATWGYSATEPSLSVYEEINTNSG